MGQPTATSLSVLSLASSQLDTEVDVMMRLGKASLVFQYVPIALLRTENMSLANENMEDHRRHGGPR